MNICQNPALNSQKTLLIGLPSLLGPHRPQGLARIVDSVPEGIAAVRKEPFDRVLVDLSTLHNAAEPSLRGLRQAAPKTQIVLLSRMLEEPYVVEWMNHRHSRMLFDDYLVCPTTAEQWSGQTTTPSEAVTSGDLQQKDRRIEELERLVIQDDLTGLKNRRYLREFLPQILELADRCHLRVTLLLFDIDDFKHYNDTYGHTVGDCVLQQAGRMIQHCCRSHDIVARLGGDEFAVVFWDLPGEKQPNQTHRDRRSAGLEHPREPIFMAERFCRELSQTTFDFIGPKGKGALTISGGLATFPTDGKTPEELFEKADMAMLEAKRSGKNRLNLVGRPTEQHP